MPKEPHSLDLMALTVQLTEAEEALHQLQTAALPKLTRKLDQRCDCCEARIETLDDTTTKNRTELSERINFTHAYVTRMRKALDQQMHDTFASLEKRIIKLESQSP